MKALVITFAEVWSSQVPLEWEQSQSVSSGKTSSGYSTVILSFPHSFIASHSSLPHPLLLHPSTPSSFTLPPPPPSPLHPFLQPSTPFLQPSTPSTPSFHSTSSSLIHSSVTPHPLPLHPPPLPNPHPSPFHPSLPSTPLPADSPALCVTGGHRWAESGRLWVQGCWVHGQGTWQTLNCGVNKTPSHFTFHSGGRWGGQLGSLFPSMPKFNSASVLSAMVLPDPCGGSAWFVAPLIAIPVWDVLTVAAVC